MENKQKFGIRKYSVGVASVLIGSVAFLALTTTPVAASEQDATQVAPVAADAIVAEAQPASLTITEKNVTSQNFRESVVNAQDGDILILQESVTARGNNETLEINKAIKIDGQGHDLRLTGLDLRVTSAVEIRDTNLQMIQDSGASANITVAGGDLKLDDVTTTLNYGERPTVTLEGDYSSFTTTNANSETKFKQIKSTGTGSKTIDLAARTSVTEGVDASASTGTTTIRSASNFVDKFVGSAADKTDLTLANNFVSDVTLTDIDNVTLDSANISLLDKQQAPTITSNVALNSSTLNIANNQLEIGKLSGQADSTLVMQEDGSLVTNTIENNPNILIDKPDVNYTRHVDKTKYVTVKDNTTTAASVKLKNEPFAFRLSREVEGNGEIWIIRDDSVRPTMPVVYKFFDIDSGVETGDPKQGFSKGAFKNIENKVANPLISASKTYTSIKPDQIKQVSMPVVNQDYYATQTEANAAKYLVPKEIAIDGYEFVAMELEPFHLEPGLATTDTPVMEEDIRTVLGTGKELALLPVLVYDYAAGDHQPTKREVYYFYRKIQPTTTVTETDPHTTTYQPNDTLPLNTHKTIKRGQNGITEVTTVGGVETRKPIQERIDAIVEVGTQPTVVTEVIKPEGETIIEDKNLDKGVRQPVSAGVDGKKVTTTTYSLDPKTGKTSPNQPTVTTTPATKPVVRVGTKDVTTSTQVIPFKTTYVEAPDKDFGYRETTTPGEKGVLTITTTNGVADAGVVTKPAKDEVITVGTKPTVTTEVLKPEGETVIEDKNLDKGVKQSVSPGVDGKKVTTTTYAFDPQTGKVTANQPTVDTTPATKPVVRVGTKEVTTATQVIPFKTTYVAAPDKDFGYRETTTPGEKGVLTITTTNGVADAGVVTKPAKDEVITVGTKTKVEETTLPYTIETSFDATLDKDQRIVDVKGLEGRVTTTTTYTLNTTTGQVTPNSTSVSVEPTTEKVRLGNKDVTLKTETIPHTTLYQADPTKDFGYSETVAKGEDGIRTITVTNGVADAGVVTKAAKQATVIVGTKPTVITEIIKPEGETVIEDKDLDQGVRQPVTPGVDGKKVTTTTYTFDPQTGKVTANQTTVDSTPATKPVVRVGTRVAPVTPVVPTPPAVQPPVTPSVPTPPTPQPPVTPGVPTPPAVQPSVTPGAPTSPTTPSPSGTTKPITGVLSPTFDLPAASLPGATSSRNGKTNPVTASVTQPASQTAGQGSSVPAQSSSTRRDDKILPKTGQESSLLALYGGLLLTGLALAKAKKKEEN